jgi:signal transduction histidine kinase
MERSVDTLLSLQKNIKYFIDDSPLAKENINIQNLILERADSFRTLYPYLNFELSLQDFKIYTNKDAFIRVVNNLLSNACKHNFEHGFVNVYSKDNTIYFENSTTGIKNPDKIFKREYKEGSRGSGLGLDIVYKLTKELNIKVETTINQKSVVFKLILDNVINS